MTPVFLQPLVNICTCPEVQRFGLTAHRLLSCSRASGGVFKFRLKINKSHWSGSIFQNGLADMVLIGIHDRCYGDQTKTRNWLQAWLTVYPLQCADQNLVNLSKIIFSTLNFFMHIFNMSVTYLPYI